MQRIARILADNPNAETQELFSHYSELQAILLRHLPPSTARLFARPERKADNYVEWYSELEGQPQLLTEKSPQFAQAERLIMQRLHAIETLCQSLSAQGRIDAGQAHFLQRLTAAARQKTYTVYLVNNEPVLIGWQAKPEPVQAAAIPPAATGSAVRRWWWLLLLVLLAGLGGTAWWWFNRAAVPASVSVAPPAGEVEVVPKTPLERIPVPPLTLKPEAKAEPIPPQTKKEEITKPEPKKAEAKKTEIKKPEPKREKTIETALQVGKKWHGKYYCSGRTALMTVEVIQRRGNRVVALEHVDYGPDERGIVYLEGVLTDKVFRARETRWHTRPRKGNWHFTSFNGTYDGKRNIFYGQVLPSSCTTFEMRESK